MFRSPGSLATVCLAALLAFPSALLADRPPPSNDRNSDSERPNSPDARDAGRRPPHDDGRSRAGEEGKRQPSADLREAPPDSAATPAPPDAHSFARPVGSPQPRPPTEPGDPEGEADVDRPPPASSISQDAAVARVRKRTGGRVVRADSRLEAAGVVHYIRIVTPDGRVRDYRVDGATGAVR